MTLLLAILVSASSFNVDSIRHIAADRLKEGQLMDAYEHATVILAHDPEDLFSLGLLKYAEYSGLVESLNPKYWMLLTESAKKISDFWEKFRSTDSLNLNLLKVLAVVLLGDPGRASPYVDLVIKLDSLNAGNYMMKGHIGRRTGDYDAAIRNYRRAYSLDSTTKDALVMLGSVHLRMANIDSACVCFSAIPRGHPYYIASRVFEVLCHLKLGRIAQAETLFAGIEPDIEASEAVFYTSGSIGTYIDKLQIDSIPETDTLILLPLGKSEPVRPLGEQGFEKYWPKIWPVAVLTSDHVDFMYGSRSVTGPKMIEFKPPRYPPECRRQNIEGSVAIMAFIDTNGSVMHAEVYSSSGHHAIDEEALAVVRKARLEPASILGIPVRTWILVPINFKLAR
ncbi:MAG: TonB family protein [candidate division WOR-3 bacterium]|nr:MAG: TonB family protein [candidate division WOR-3 bacterium]